MDGSIDALKRQVKSLIGQGKANRDEEVESTYVSPEKFREAFQSAIDLNIVSFEEVADTFSMDDEGKENLLSLYEGERETLTHDSRLAILEYIEKRFMGNEGAT